MTEFVPPRQWVRAAEGTCGRVLVLFLNQAIVSETGSWWVEMERFVRPKVSPERYRELEVIYHGMMIMMPIDDGEAMIVRDLIDNAMRRRLADERLEGHSVCEKKEETANRLRLV